MRNAEFKTRKNMEQSTGQQQVFSVGRQRGKRRNVVRAILSKLETEKR
jgi:hypothetical protein